MGNNQTAQKEGHCKPVIFRGKLPNYVTLLHRITNEVPKIIPMNCELFYKTVLTA